jgi:LysR family transcriptional regulator, glycine cleavage system transcriptional activator
MESMRIGHASPPFDFGRDFPPLHALTVFVTAARCGTFSQAARELFVTQAAVSRQIQHLEAYLGAALFVRHKRGLSLTAEAELLLPTVNEVMHRLKDVCERVRSAGQILTLRMPPTFASRWFIHRLPSLQTFMPDVEIRVSTFHSWGPRFEDGDIDAAIVQGTGPWDQANALRVVEERLTPMCTADFASGLAAPQDLLGLPLLRCYPIGAWETWFERAGVRPEGRVKGQVFDTSDLALSAAIRGQGVVLGDINLVEECIHEGSLVAPFATIAIEGPAYCLVYSADRAALPKIQALTRWLEATGAKMDRDSSG